MRIESIRAVPTLSAFFFDDQRAIVQGAERDGFGYRGDPVTPGFDAIREPGEALTVEIDLSDGTTATGDCAAVQYSGAGGRDPRFVPDDYRSVIEGQIAAEFAGRDPYRFGRNSAILRGIADPITGTDRLHTAVRYGVSQALLSAAATARRTTMTDVLAEEFDTDPANEPVPVFGQSGDARRVNARKMLKKRVPVLPHGLFNSLEKVGREGEKLVEYVRWLAESADEIGTEAGDTDSTDSADSYDPRFHVDVYGTLGELFGPPYDRPEVVDYFRDLQQAAGDYDLSVEGPIDAGGRAEQIHAMSELRDGLGDAGIGVDLVADEWCNTLSDVRAFVDAGAADFVQVKTPDLGGIGRSAEAVLACRGTDTRAYLGGTCNETDTSARACAHVALATDAGQLLAKPGMGFDEGFMIVTNEMRRTLARRRHARGDSRSTETDPEATADD
ncbi:methylaspartate ammonia-lyase [Salinirubrum litoreum]|uniref:methylaspartate ammonia-lyase n=1 Tax=Salinirubrum litoreum TaxID=1126234 RepID=A0ABD5R9Q3_9EURY|nr:methylaspartate ammonia-lyase [Salinirubrum litoreum]